MRCQVDHKFCTSQYTYTQLPSPTALHLHVRFIRLDPNLSSNGLMRCSLVQGRITREAHNRFSSLMYYALSYEWGSEDDQSEIEVDGCRFSIRQNLWRYLEMARKRPELHTTLLWVDAVCINQENIQERNEQVTGMGEVYACAERVVVWLGHGNTTIERTLEFLQYCHTSTSGNERLMLDDSEDECEYSPAKLKAHRASLELLARNRFGLVHGSLNVHLSQVLDLTYWTRAWVAQELFHARCISTGPYSLCDFNKHVTLHYGEQSISIECLRSSANAIKYLLRPSEPGFWRFESFIEYMNILNGTTPKLDLHKCFNIFNDWPANSTDPRDLIYALRSMFLGGERLQVEYAESLDLLLLRMLVQLKHSHFVEGERNWLYYNEARTLIEIASRFDLSVLKFRSLLFDALEKLELVDTSKLSLGLWQHYEEAVRLLNTGFVKCDCPIHDLPRKMLFSKDGHCLGCNTFRPVLPTCPKEMRNCSLCDIEILPWNAVLSSSVRCQAYWAALLIPPGFPSNTRYACNLCPALSVNTHLWLASRDLGNGHVQNIHVLDLTLVGIPWRMQFSLPNVHLVSHQEWKDLALPDTHVGRPEGWNKLILDFKTWLQISVLDDIRQRSYPDDSEDHIACVQDLVRKVKEIARPRREDEVLPLDDLTFWFVNKITPGHLFTVQEFEVRLSQTGVDVSRQVNLQSDWKEGRNFHVVGNQVGGKEPSRVEE